MCHPSIFIYKSIAFFPKAFLLTFYHKSFCISFSIRSLQIIIFSVCAPGFAKFWFFEYGLWTFVLVFTRIWIVSFLSHLIFATKGFANFQETILIIEVLIFQFRAVSTKIVSSLDLPQNLSIIPPAFFLSFRFPLASGWFLLAAHEISRYFQFLSSGHFSSPFFESGS